MTAQELKAWRIEQGWTQSEAAHHLGVQQNTVSRWENEDTQHGRAIPQSIALLAHLLTFAPNIPRVEVFRK